MDINFDRINNDLGNIVGEFENLLNQGKYDEARDAVNAIIYELSANTNIALSMGGNTADNNFHELYIQLVQKISDRASSHVAPEVGNVTDYDALKMLLDNASTQLFKTSEVRKVLIEKNPDMDEYREALQQGLVESQQNKDKLQKDAVKYRFIENELFVDPSNGVDRRTVIEKERENARQLQEVIDTIDAINSNIAAKAATTDPTTQANIQSQIDTQKNELRAKLTQLQSQGLDISSLGVINDFLQDANLATSKTNSEALRDARIQVLIREYEAIRAKIMDAKNGSITYTDADGNVENIANEEVIRLAPDVSTFDLNTDAGRNQLESLIGQITAVSKRISNEILVCNQEMEIFNDHIKVMDFERDQLSKDINDRQAYIDAFDQTTRDRIADEEVRRHEDAKAKFNGDRRKAREYRAAWNRFRAHRRTQHVTEIVNGESYEYDYDYLEDYPEKDDDLEFMQLESWEVKSKRTALIEKMLEGVEDPSEQLRLIASVYEDDTIKEIEERLANYSSNAYGVYGGSTVTQDMIDAANRDLEAARSRVAMQFSRDCDYVKNYNCSHFDVRDTVALALTGGSAIRSRKNQSKKNLTFGDAMGAFFKWTPYDVKADGRRHVLLTTLSNIGGIVSLPVRTLKVAIGAGIAGVTAIAGRITGTYDMPTPYNVGYFHRKEARQEYYREHGSTRIGAWFKSFFNMNVRDENGNNIRINDKIVQDRCKLIDESIEDKYIRGARAKLIQDQIAAKKNQKARAIAYKNRAKSAELYEDIYENNPEYIAASPEEKKKIAQRLMQRAALEMGGKTARPITNQSKSYVTNGRKRTGRFVQNNPGEMYDSIEYDIKQGYDFSETIGDTIWTNAASRENIQRGNTKGMDLTLRIAAAATLPFFKGILSKWTIALKKKNPDIVEPSVKQPDTVIPGKHVDDHVEYIHGTKTIYQHRPKYGDINREVTVNENVPLSYENATFGDLQRGDTANWCAKWESYFGPHKPVTFSKDATEVQGFNLSFEDPLSGKHVEWSTSMTQIKDYINQHPGLNEATTTYQDLSGLNGVPIKNITDYLPDDIKESYIRYMDAAVDKGEAFNKATRICVGIPSHGGPIMSQGWCEGDIALGAMKQITGTKTITVRGIVGEEVVPVRVPHVYEKVIKGYDIPDKIIPGEVIPGRVIPGGNKTIDIPQAYVLGAMSDSGDVLAQCASPRYRRAQRNTKNYHGKDVNGRTTIDGNQGRYDMYDTPTLTDGNPSTYKKYESHHSINDRALTSRDSQGRPTRNDGRWDDDDFLL